MLTVNAFYIIIEIFGDIRLKRLVSTTIMNISYIFHKVNMVFRKKECP